MRIHLTDWTPLTHLTHLTDWTPLSHVTHWTHETQISRASEPPTTTSHRLAGSEHAPFFFLCLQLLHTPSNVTLLIGIASLTDAVLQTALALILSTSAFLIATTAIHIGVIVGIALGMFVFFWVKSNFR